ncbi:MAG: hypothetical protein Q7U28_09275 [Aquabacterium sp.]|nr:hypothetical protein [Aquabacterium sp.]
MKIINSPVRSTDLELVACYCSKPKTLAAAKKIVRKQERARLRQQARLDLIQDHLVSLAEKVEQNRLDREKVFENLMRKAMSKNRPRNRNTVNVQPEPYFNDRFEFRIMKQSNTGERDFAVLASCAVDRELSSFCE